MELDLMTATGYSGNFELPVAINVRSIAYMMPEYVRGGTTIMFVGGGKVDVKGTFTDTVNAVRREKAKKEQQGVEMNEKWLLWTLLFGVFGFAAGFIAAVGESLGEDTERPSLREAFVKGGRWHDWRFQNMWERGGVLAFILGCSVVSAASRFYAVGEQPEKEDEERREERVEGSCAMVGGAALPARLPGPDCVNAVGKEAVEDDPPGSVGVAVEDAVRKGLRGDVPGRVEVVAGDGEFAPVPALGGDAL